MRLSVAAAPHYLAEVDLFSRSWTALREAVAELSDEDLTRPSGCTGWLVRDLVCHLVIDAQDVLITLVTPAEGEPTRDAVTYWDISEDAADRRGPARRADRPAGCRVRGVMAAQVPPGRRRFGRRPCRRTRRPGAAGGHPQPDPHHGRLPLRVRP
ncbi:maleylpyruvate isomerase N-terminal domain-containing protein [Streptomyces sp. GLT-R25]